jgi:hypothetical protein
VSLFAGGCSEPPPRYDPETFREEVTRLIDAKQYAVAVAFLDSVDIKRQAEFDRTGYIAVGEIMIVLPGVDRTVDYDRSRDWFMPGTSDVVEDGNWQRAATEFAAAYNQHRSRDKPPPR